jgi:hypothetical protein
MRKKFLCLLCLFALVSGCSKNSAPAPEQPKTQASPAPVAPPETGVQDTDLVMWHAGQKWLGSRQTNPDFKGPVSFSIAALDVKGGNQSGKRPLLTVICQKSQTVVMVATGPVTSGRIQYQVDDQPKANQDWRVLGGDTLSPRDETAFARKFANGKKMSILYDGMEGAGLATFQTLNLKDLLSQEKTCKF